MRPKLRADERSLSLPPSFVQSIARIVAIDAMDVRSLDLNLLRALDVLLEERHVTRAAARLNLTQPATSAALARLRSAFGDALLVRGGSGLVPTPRAADLAPRVRALMQGIADLGAPPRRFEPAAAQRRFVLATTDYVHALLAPWLGSLERSARGVDLALVTLDTARVAERMERGDVDLAVINLQAAPEGLRSRRVLTDRFVVIGRRSHPKLRRTLTLDAFCALEHVLVSPRGGGFSGPTDEALAERGLKRRVRLSVQGFLQVPELVASSDLIAVFPERLARLHADRLKIVPAPLAIPGFTMVSAWHERAQLDPAHQWLREAVLDALRAA
jgi:DNA-binding transcriptional LysR family regulator